MDYKSTKNIIITTLILSTTASLSAFADPKNYQIEMIIFEQADKQAINQEAWPKDPGKPIMTQARIIPAVTSTQFELKDTAAHLKRTGHRVILHTAWQQAISESNQSYAVKIEGGKNYESLGDPTYEIQGTLRASVSKFLHVDSDIVLLKSVNITKETDNHMVSINNSETGPTLHAFRQKQSTKMRSNELHYIDNPVFGMVVLIQPVAVNPS